MSKLLVDLHTHSTASDGQYSPSDLVAKAKNEGLQLMALTDHDSLNGILEAETAAKKVGIDFIRGVELNIQYPTGEFHLLGLGLKNISSSLEEVIEKLQNGRIERNFLMFDKIKEKFPGADLDEIKNMFPDTVLGRPHFARYLSNKGFVKSNQEAFDRYLAKGRECYVPRIGANLDEAIVAIGESGGVPVLAHPMSLYLSWGKLPDAVKEIFDRGVVGMEAFHPGARATDCFRLDELGRKIGFFITGASDFHGEKVRADRRLAHTCGNKKIDERLLPDLEDTIRRIRG